MELQEEAVHLTAFSLALAICDALQPNVIWEKLRFDKLVGTNLQISDLSAWLKSRQGNAKLTASLSWWEILRSCQS